MTVFVSARYGYSWNYMTGDSGWGGPVNYLIRSLDALNCCYLLSDSLTSDPASPADGDSYFTGGTPGGAWVGQANKIAAYQGGSWQFYPIPNGFRVRIASRSGFFYWVPASGWTAETTAGTSFSATQFATTDLSGLPTSNPGGGKPWLNGNVVQVGA